MNINIWAKLLTALRGGVNEAGEAIVDTQALRILDQEVRDASEELKKSKDHLAELMAREKVSEEKISSLKKEIAENEGYAIKALEESKSSLATEVAGKIANLEDQLENEKAAEKEYASSVKSLRETIRATEQHLQRLKQQVDTVKATESVQRAQSALAERHSGTDSKMRTAMDSLERIKEKQSLKGARMKAAQELAKDNNGSGLQQRLEEAGIAPSHSAEEVLARLKEKSKQ